MLTTIFAAFRSLPLFTQAVFGFVIVSLIAVTVLAINHFIDRAFTTAEAAGETKAAARAATQTLDKVEDANVAAEEIARDPAARDAACLRHARNPEDC